jgi:ankyrin repeat protein
MLSTLPLENPDLLKSIDPFQIGIRIFMKKIIFLIMLVLSGQLSAMDLNSELVAAVMAGKASFTRDLVAAGADVNTASPAGRPVLVLAAANGNKRTTQALLVGGANVNAQDQAGNSALMEASAFGYTDVVELLIATGADVNLKNTAGEGALKKANRAGNTAVAELLTKAGATEEAAAPAK